MLYHLVVFRLFTLKMIFLVNIHYWRTRVKIQKKTLYTKIPWKSDDIFTVNNLIVLEVTVSSGVSKSTLKT